MPPHDADAQSLARARVLSQDALVRVLLDAPTPMSVWHRDGGLLLTNRAFARLFGAPLPADADILRDARFEALRTGFEQAASGTTVHLATLWFGPEGRASLVAEPGHTPASPIFTPTRDGDGRVECVSVTYRDDREGLLASAARVRDEPPPSSRVDVARGQAPPGPAGVSLENLFVASTEELVRTNEALRRSEVRFRRLTEAGIVGVVVSDLGGRILEANDAFLSMVGYSRADVASGQLHGAVLNTPQRLRTDAAALVSIGAEGKAAPWEKELVRKDGTRVAVLCAVIMLEGGTLLSLVLELTAQKRAQAAVAEAELLRREKRATEEMNAELEAFSYSVAHDLRAPLRAIRSFSEVLREDHAHALDEPARDLLARISANVQRMGHLIEALLALARLSRAEIHRERVDLGSLARAVEADLRAAEPHRTVDFAVGERLLVDGDPSLLRALLENLLGNAWKFTRRRAIARVALLRAVVDGETCYAVRDNGDGFDMVHAAKLFSPFQRLHTSEQFEGTGVGLATVKRIVRRHGGRAWAEARPDEGATIYFTLPRNEQGAPAAPDTMRPS